MSSFNENFTFSPQVWGDTIQAYIRRKNLFLSLAFVDESFTGSTGDTVNLPYFSAITGEAQKIRADQSPIINTMDNNKFPVTMYEVVDAVGITDAQKIQFTARNSAKSFSGYEIPKDPMDDWSDEVLRQMTVRFGTRLDKDLLALMQQPGSFVQGFTATTASDRLTMDVILKSKFGVFGDRANEATTIICHPLQFSDFVSSVGGLAAFNMNAIRQDLLDTGMFQGKINGLDFFIYDHVPAGAAVSGKSTYTAYMLKEHPFGVLTKVRPGVEHAREAAFRRDVFVATAWFGVTTLNQKISSEDVRVCAITTTVS